MSGHSQVSWSRMKECNAVLRMNISHGAISMLIPVTAYSDRIDRNTLCLSYVGHVLIGKAVSTFPEHALQNRGHAKQLPPVSVGEEASGQDERDPSRDRGDRQSPGVRLQGPGVGVRCA